MARIAQLVIKPGFSIYVSRIQPSLPAGCYSRRGVITGGVLFWYGLLARPSLQITSVGSAHHSKENGGSQHAVDN